MSRFLTCHVLGDSLGVNPHINNPFSRSKNGRHAMSRFVPLFGVESAWYAEKRVDKNERDIKSGKLGVNGKIGRGQLEDRGKLEDRGETETMRRGTMGD